MELSNREEIIKILKMQLSEEKRQVETLKKKLPGRRSVEQELVTLQIQYAQCQDRMHELEQQVEDPNTSNRTRLIEGKDPAPLELKKKVEELEERLATKEEQTLEKDLIYDQVCRLVEQTKKKIGAEKDDTLSLAKKVNSIRSKIKQITQKQIACVAELAMLQAESFQKHQEVRMKENMLEQCYIRLEKGEAPTVDMEEDWLRMIRDEERRLKDKESSQYLTDQDDTFVLPNGCTTTAEPRPNAYIPESEHDLPIPHPYGRNAPFRPSEPGSTMRHIRKPILKPIEL